jgi:protein-S-isoprenylcysteine O-methyltransferase Ste14
VPAHAGAPPAVARLFLWLGAALFFVSLAYFLVSYVTTFGVPAAGSARAPAVAWNVALFTLFALHHSVLARAPMRQWVARLLPAPPLERSLYVWVASILLIAVCALWRPVPGVAWDVDGILLWALRLIQAAGVWLTLRSAAILDIRELAGVAVRTPDGQAPDVEFRTTGPYGWVRHPIYTGWFLIVFAAAPMTMTRFVFAVVSCVYLLIAIPFEERSMRAAAASTYARYVAQVRWRLLPGVY